MDTRLKEVILSKGTYEDAAKATGISVRTIKRLCTEQNYDPKLSVLAAISAYTQLPANIVMESVRNTQIKESHEGGMKREIISEIGGLILEARQGMDGITFQMRGDEMILYNIKSLRLFVKRNRVFNDYFLMGFIDNDKLIIKVRINKKQVTELAFKLKAGVEELNER